MDSVNDRKLFSLESLLHPNIYRSFFDNGVYESTAPLLELPIPPNTEFLTESSPQPQNDPWHSDSIVAAAKPSLVLDDTQLEQFVDQQKNWNMKIIIIMCICIISTLRRCAITLCDMEKYHHTSNSC